jgi:hypothetical protein
VIEFYAEIRLAHITAVVASGALFLLRGVLVQAGHPRLALAPLPRVLSYAIARAHDPLGPVTFWLGN